MKTDTIYLDYAAATPVDGSVLNAMTPYYSELFYNPSSSHSAAVKVRREYEFAKQRLAQTFGAKGDELVMTAGATESINLAFSGITGNILTSRIEHAAVVAAAERKGNVTWLKPTMNGMITADAVKEAITEDTELVSVQLANHEIGTIQPLRDISESVKHVIEKRKSNGNNTPLWLHCDASQGFGMIDVNVARLGVDMLTLNAGKIYGPKQVGLLWMKPAVHVNPTIVGGGQERGLRSGTENVAGVIGFAQAAEIAVRKNTDNIADLRNTMQADLQSEFPDAVVSGHPKKRLPNFLHICFPDVDAERLIYMLEDQGVYVATGSACAASKNQSSQVLDAIGMSADLARGSLRVTLGRGLDERQIATATEQIIEAVKNEYERTSRG